MRLLRALALLLLWLPAGQSPATGESVPAGEFAAAIREIRRICEFHPPAAGDLVARAGELAQADGGLAAQVRLQAAAAPYYLMVHGYAPAKQELVALLLQVKDLPEAAELIPLLRLAACDIALRAGDTTAAVRQMIRAMRGLDPETPVEVRQLLLYHLLILAVEGYDIDFAQEVGDTFSALGWGADLFWRDRLMLLRARLLGHAGNIEGMRQQLERFAGEVDHQTDPLLLKAFWAIRALCAIQSDSPAQAEKFIETARYVELPGMEAALEGQLLLLLAAVADFRLWDPAITRQLLESSSKAYADAGHAGFFSPDFFRVFALTPTDLSEVDSDILAAVAGSPGDQLLFLPDASINYALAELLRREGDLPQAYKRLQAGIDQRMDYHHSLAELNAEWRGLQTQLLNDRDLAGGNHSFYLLVLLLVLVVGVLFLLLRIRTQGLINTSLREAVEQSRLAERAAADASRLKSQFLSNISHEIKTPMSGLVGMASILDELVTDPVQRKYLTTIQECSRNLLVLVNDLLDLGRMESNRIEIERAPFRPADTLQYSVQVVLPAAQARNLELVLRLDPQVPDLLIGDSIRLGQILVNLLTNAIKFTHAGQVTLHAGYNHGQSGTGELVVQILDTGIGIAPDRLDVIFDPFNQNDMRKRHPAEGSGLGLAICRKLSELMGGSIAVESTPGKGSLFTVRLPLPAHSPTTQHE